MGDKTTRTPDIEAGGSTNSTSSTGKLPRDMPPPDSEKVVVLSFRGLQLQRIAQLQDQLIRLSIQSARLDDEEHRKDVDLTLASYAQALQNYETLSKNAVSDLPSGARFIGILGEMEDVGRGVGKISTKWLPTRLRSQISALLTIIEPAMGVMSRHTTALSLLDSLVQNKEPANRAGMKAAIEKAMGQVGYREVDQHGRILRAQKKAHVERMLFALLGGVALIGPVLIMTLHSSKNTSLVTISVATFLFAFVTALGARNLEGKDVLADTAAYAAVLVVFVGTSLPSGS